MSESIGERARRSAVETLIRDLRLPDPGDVAVVLVDDERTSLELSRAFLERGGFRVSAFDDSTEALAHIRETPPSLLITDLSMPGIGGAGLIDAARDLDPHLGVVVVTASVTPEITATLNELSGVQVVEKPVSRAGMDRAVQRAILRRTAADHHAAVARWINGELERNEDAIRQVTLGTLAALINTADARSPHFRGHSGSVALQAAAVAEAMGLSEDEVEEVHTAGLLHDIGMMAVPDHIIQKPGPLTPDETALVRRHCEFGAEILEPLPHLGAARLYVLEHHERWDGSGYPGGKVGSDISTGGAILGISEAWTSILETRAYRDARSRREALDMLLSHRGKWFSADVTDALAESDIGLLG